MGRHNDPSLKEYEDSLVEAAENGRLGVVRLIITKYPDIFKDEALESAIKAGNVEMARLLIEFGADVFHNQTSAIYTAAANGCIAILRYLVGLGVDFSYDTALIHASVRGRIDVVRFLATLGANIKTNERCFLRAAETGRIEVVKFFEENGFNIRCSNNRALFVASQDDLVRFFVERGMYIDNTDYTTLCTSNYERIRAAVRSVLGIKRLPSSKEEIVNMLEIHNINRR